ncbi:hypothetical protein ANN_16547 [Periplaneta americana]|uniref:Lipase n=1 Tax=Periplaneta americana TaxID=6978 RepID=A0ABQ8SS15_PERAM|nr:hypothetical protein ANN_16547 [Periplaneta americana]
MRNASFSASVEEQLLNNNLTSSAPSTEDSHQAISLTKILSGIWFNVINEDPFLTTPELIQQYGYPVEIHNVTTADGYILSLHRIPYGLKSKAAPNKPIVFLQHGILATSSDWIIMGPENSLGYLLADAGYDVWLGNSRGNFYSKNHVSMQPSEPAFWDFSWHEMGIYDLPAVLDYVLWNTSQESLNYVGFSMGSTVLYVLMSMKPEYNSKVQLAISLAPVAFMSNFKSPLLKLVAQSPLTEPMTIMLGIREFLPHGKLLDAMVDEVCSDKSLVQTICSNFIFTFCGYEPEEMNMTLLPLLLSHVPAGISAKTALHYCQDIRTGKFRQWDYGLVKNFLKYGSFSPPEYNLKAISIPVRLMYSESDWFGDPEDIHKLNKSLGNSLGEYRVSSSSFSHLDFVWAIHVKKLVNDEILRFLSHFQDTRRQQMFTI